MEEEIRKYKLHLENVELAMDLLIMRVPAISILSPKQISDLLNLEFTNVHCTETDIINVSFAAMEIEDARLTYKHVY